MKWGSQWLLGAAGFAWLRRVLVGDLGFVGGVFALRRAGWCAGVFGVPGLVGACSS